MLSTRCGEGRSLPASNAGDPKNHEEETVNEEYDASQNTTDHAKDAANVGHAFAFGIHPAGADLLDVAVPHYPRRDCREDTATGHPQDPKDQNERAAVRRKVAAPSAATLVPVVIVIVVVAARRPPFRPRRLVAIAIIFFLRSARRRCFRRRGFFHHGLECFLAARALHHLADEVVRNTQLPLARRAG